MNFASDLMMRNQQESTQENGIEMLSNMNCEENWAYKLKKRRTEQEVPTWRQTDLGLNDRSNAEFFDSLLFATFCLFLFFYI